MICSCRRFRSGVIVFLVLLNIRSASADMAGIVKVSKGLKKECRKGGFCIITPLNGVKGTNQSRPFRYLKAYYT